MSYEKLPRQLPSVAPTTRVLCDRPQPQERICPIIQQLLGGSAKVSFYPDLAGRIRVAQIDL
ncbi:MAG: hypothetical protein U0517_03770 [Candidatus Andersenbacteria bacterium]